MNAVEVLRAIPAHLDAHGWCQGFDHDGEGAACLRGAINDLALEDSVRAEVNLRFQLSAGSLVVAWNDAPGRTVDEVKAAVLDAAELDDWGVDLRDADLRGAYLRGADLRDADLRGAGLCGVDLRDADLRGAYLRGADLRYVYLRAADLRGVDLTGVDLRAADLRGSRYDKTTAWPDGFSPPVHGAVAS